VKQDLVDSLEDNNPRIFGSVCSKSDWSNTLDEQLYVRSRGDAYNFICDSSQHHKDPVIGPLLTKLGIYFKVLRLQFKR
jgi:hypothetical protein